MQTLHALWLRCWLDRGLQVSAELAEAAAGADLVVLEGMGRSIETNLHARFWCAAVGGTLRCADACEPALLCFAPGGDAPNPRGLVCPLPGCSVLSVSRC